MNTSALIRILSTPDGSLPDINLDFGTNAVAGDIYALIQSRASCLVSRAAYYWSISEQREYPIRFGDNPALDYLSGEAEPFHVVFGGVRSSSGRQVPDLGVFILGPGFVALDYRMGPEWAESEVLGLFEILGEISSLCPMLTVTHENCIFDPDGSIFQTAFADWLRDQG